MKDQLKAQPILEAALAGGGQWSEIFVENSTGLTIIMDDGKVEKIIGGVDRGAGLRLVYDSRTAYAHSNDQTTEGLLPLARNLASLAGGGAQAPAALQRLKPDFQAKVVKPFASAETSLKVEMVRAAEAAARAVDPRIRQVKVTYADRMQEVYIASSLGSEVDDVRPYLVMMVHCMAADDGLVQTGYESAGGLGGLELLDEADPEGIARIAARRALLQLEADPAPGGAMPVVLGASAGGTMIHEAVGHGLEGDHVNENMSVYAGKVGEPVASSLVSVADDATLPGRRGSYGFDDEGVPGQNTLLIEKGVLKGYMHDRLSAHKMGVEPTGNGRRESYRFRPVPRMSNTLILPGEDDPQAVLKDTPNGLYVAKMGGGQVNTVNGDFVFEVSEGYMIENGAIGRPVRGATLTGNGPKVLMEIDRVASDLGYSLGTCGKDGQGAPVADAQPTLRIPSLVVGGMHQG
jgi:TldD protein